MHVQGNIDLAGLIDNTDKGPVIKLTAYGKEGRCMTIKEISNMSFEELAAVHTVSILLCIGLARLSSTHEHVPTGHAIPATKEVRAVDIMHLDFKPLVASLSLTCIKAGFCTGFQATFLR
jgi:hypothetical protein